MSAALNSSLEIPWWKEPSKEQWKAWIAASHRIWMTAAIVFLSIAIATGAAMAQKSYAPGVSDNEIKIGQTMPYSGPVSAWGTVGRAELAYFKMVNDQGGVNGRKINLISLDDAFSPPKTVEQTRRLVEQEN